MTSLICSTDALKRRNRKHLLFSSSWAGHWCLPCLRPWICWIQTRALHLHYFASRTSAEYFGMFQSPQTCELMYHHKSTSPSISSIPSFISLFLFFYFFPYTHAHTQIYFSENPWLLHKHKLLIEKLSIEDGGFFGRDPELSAQIIFKYIMYILNSRENLSIFKYSSNK